MTSVRFSAVVEPARGGHVVEVALWMPVDDEPREKDR
jgi:hypothetical protein